MANSLAAAVAHITAKLDEGYRRESLTTDVSTAPAWIEPARSAGEFRLPKFTLVGMGNVSGGIMPVGDVTQEWVTYQYTYKRGRTLQVAVDDKNDAARVAQIALLSRKYMRDHVIPEVDAVRFAKFYAGADAAHKIPGAITDSAGAIAATNAALVALTNAEAIPDRCIGYFSAAMLDLLDNAASTEKKARVLTRLSKIVEVPTSRFNTAVTVDAGATSSAGGFSLTGSDINFMIVDPEAVFADTKHNVDRFFPSEVNQTGDLDRWDYYAYHDAWVLSEMDKGVYVHFDPATS